MPQVLVAPSGRHGYSVMVLGGPQCRAEPVELGHGMRLQPYLPEWEHLLGEWRARVDAAECIQRHARWHWGFTLCMPCWDMCLLSKWVSQCDCCLVCEHNCRCAPVRRSFPVIV